LLKKFLCLDASEKTLQEKGESPLTIANEIRSSLSQNCMVSVAFFTKEIVKRSQGTVYVVGLCFFKTLFQCVFLLLIFETMHLHTNNPVNEPKSQTSVHTAKCVYVQAGACGIPKFFYNFCVIINWSSIGRC